MKAKAAYFGLTTLVIAIVMVIATRANSRYTPYYYYNPNLPITLRCVFVNEPSWCQPELTTPCTYANSGYQIYLEKQGIDCIMPLYTPW